MSESAPLDVESESDGDEDDVPDWVEECDHIDCPSDSVELSRLCEDCIPIMKASEPNECPHCGTTFGA